MDGQKSSWPSPLIWDVLYHNNLVVSAEWCTVRSLAQIGHFVLMPLTLPSSSSTSMYLKKFYTSDQDLFNEVRIIEVIGELEAISSEVRPAGASFSSCHCK